jgi:hypothetical protein
VYRSLLVRDEPPGSRTSRSPDRELDGLKVERGIHDAPHTFGSSERRHAGQRGRKR